MLRPLAAALLLVAAPALAQEGAPPAPAPEVQPAQPADPDEPAPVVREGLGDGGRVGVALIGLGAIGAAGTGAGISLLEALSKNDTNPGAPPKSPELVQVSGFVVVTAMSLSAAVMLVGGALLVNDIAD